MAYNVKFLKGTAAQYAALASKDANTFYFLTDTDKVYLGTIELSGSSTDSKVGDLANLNTTAKNNVVAAINEVLANEGALSSLTTTAKNTLAAAINEIDDHTDTNTTAIGTLSSLETTAKTNLVAAINELKGIADDIQTDMIVTLNVASTPTTGYLKTYEIYQGGSSAGDLVGKIDIPKDMVIQSGRVVVNPTGQPAGTYIELTLANADSTKIYINVEDLVDVYTVAASATQVQLAIDSSNVISATLVDGGVSTAKLANSAVTTAKIADSNVTTAKIADENVTKGKLASGVQASLDKADSAIQGIATGTANGQIRYTVDGTTYTAVSVYGLKSAAYTESNAYDPAGSAAAVLGTSSDTKTDITVYGTRKYAESEADDAEAAAKAYTDTALTWGSIA